MLLAPVLLLMAAILIAPDTAIGRFLRHIMVERPAMALSRITFRYVLRGAALLLTIVIMFWLLQQGGLQFLAGAAPDAITWLLASDIATLLEAAAALAFIASVTRLRTIPVVLRHIFLQRFARARSREIRSGGTASARPLKAANDNDDGSWRRAA